MSSAYISATHCCSASGRSLINTRNKIGPKILPCGTQSVTDLLVEWHPFIFSTDFFHSNSRGTGEEKSHPLQAPSASIIAANGQSNRKPSYGV